MPRATNERAPLPGDRILMVPGPSNLHPRTIQALIAPVASHKDPEFMAIMVDMADLLRR